EFLHGLREGLHVFGRDEVAIFAVDDGFAAAGGVGGNDGSAHGGGFEGGAGGTFPTGGEDIDVAIGNGRTHVGLVAMMINNSVSGPFIQLLSPNAVRMFSNTTNEFKLHLRVFFLDEGGGLGVFTD